MKKLWGVKCTWVLIIFILFSITLANAGEVDTKSDGSAIWKAGVDGVEFESNNGNWRVYSMKSHPVQIPDRQGINKAQTIAEEKAKGAIIRWMEETRASGKLVATVDTDLNKTTYDKGTKKTSSSTSRYLIENVTEFEASISTGKLSGVILLERGYDQKREEVWVKVGLSRKTIKAARDLKNAIAGEQPTDESSGQSNQSGSGIRFPGSEVQKTKQKDW